MTTWYDRDDFWETFRPSLFGERRWEMAPAEVDSLLELTDLEPGAHVLDLCCGPGRHALVLARRGFRVTGVDRTAAYLDAARQKAADEELEVEFVQEDMRRFVRPDAFDMAINLFTSFGYFKDPANDLQVAKNLHASLKPGGKLVMEMMGREVLARIFRPRDWGWLDEEEGVIQPERPAAGGRGEAIESDYAKETAVQRCEWHNCKSSARHRWPEKRARGRRSTGTLHPRRGS